ncbi:MAG: hypothetical protein O7D91_17640 [Planctomycetota bacterium]|nr:hypothetical protein [Planctomycetota bacterium]
MKPAKDWLKSLDTCVPELEGERWLVGVSDILARDIEVLEEAAKLMCPMCYQGLWLSQLDSNGEWQHRVIDTDTGQEYWYGCSCDPIHDRIAELKKEQADGTS